MAGDRIGQTLAGTYALTRLLGEGGMGTVYEARNVRLPKKFAVKFLHAEALRDPEVFGRFRREAEVTSALGHPHIVDVVDFNHDDQGVPYIVLEYLEGEDLAARLKKQGPLSAEETGRIVDQVADALGAAHEQGVVHRDLKPQNVFLVRRQGRSDWVKVVDFGISKVLHAGSAATRTGMIFGTPNYMSPEQAEGSVSEIDARTDVFALGAMMYEMLAGRVAFDAPTPIGVIRQVCDKQPPPLHTLRPDLPDPIVALIDRALAKRREDRWTTMADLRAALQEATRDPTGPARRWSDPAVSVPSPAPEPVDPTPDAPTSATLLAPVPPPVPPAVVPSVTVESRAPAEPAVPAPVSGEAERTGVPPVEPRIHPAGAAIEQAIFTEVAELTTAGADPLDLKDGLDRACEVGVGEIVRQSRAVERKEEIARFASGAANGDHLVGAVIAEAMEKVGKEGVITIVESDDAETTLDVVEGMHFDGGFLSPRFITDRERGEAVLDDCFVLCHESPSLRDLQPLLREVADSEKPLLIVAGQAEDDSLAMLVDSHARGRLRLCVVRAPGPDEDRRDLLHDIAVATGGQAVTDDLGAAIAKLTLRDLGRAGRVEAGRDRTLIVDGRGPHARVEGHIKGIRTLLDMTRRRAVNPDGAAGLRFDGGYWSHYFLTDVERMICELEDPYVLVCQGSLSSGEALTSLLDQVAKRGSNLLIVAEHVEREVLATLVYDKLLGRLWCCAVKTPAWRDQRRELLNDIASATRGRPTSHELGFRIEDLGRAQRATVDRYFTTIVGGAGRAAEVEARFRNIPSSVDQALLDRDRDKLRLRLARLVGGGAVIRAGAPTADERAAKRGAFEAALEAARAAIEEGVVPGGGVALVRALPALEKLAAGLDGDRRRGVELLSRAMEQPLRQAALAAGLDGTVLVEQTKRPRGALGFFLRAKTAAVMEELGVDPTRAICLALQEAVSRSGARLVASGEGSRTDRASSR